MYTEFGINSYQVALTGSRGISTLKFLDYSYTNPHKKPALASKRKIMLNTFLLCFWLPQIFFRTICLKMPFSFRLTIAYNAYHTMYLWILWYIIILIMLIITPQKRTATNNISSSGDGKKYIVCSWFPENIRNLRNMYIPYNEVIILSPIYKRSNWLSDRWSH